MILFLLQMKFRTLQDLKDVAGKRVLLRLDLNVPIEDERVVDGFRIIQSVPTVKMLRDMGAKVIILAHLEPLATPELPSLAPVCSFMKKYVPVTFIREKLGEGAEEKLVYMKDGDVVMLENIRVYEGEKKNDPEFAKMISSLGDIYVNEAFSVSHREHVSIVGIPQYLPGYAGMLFNEEVRTLSMSFQPERPFLFVLGGAKFDTKLPLIKKFLEIADHVYISGALANDCYKAKGLNVGKSVVSGGDFDLQEIVSNPKVMLPTEVVVENGGIPLTKRVEDVGDNDIIYDAGKGAVGDIKDIVNKCRFILWNGPLGNYEKGYRQGTYAMARAIGESGARAIVGGGDTLAAISELNIEDRFAFVSTAGGAMLDFLANETLVGINALEKSPQ